MDLEDIFTPVDYEQLDKLLLDTNYNDTERRFLVDGFKNGFDLGYRGPTQIQQKAPNLKFTIGNSTELWNKVMKEVKEKRYAGPFETIPFENYIQSPIGLVPKDNGKKTRLIFHLSYPRRVGGISINNSTPEEFKKVSYPSFDDAVRLCLKEGKNCHAGKSDMTAAFRHFAIMKKYWKYLVMKAKSPKDGKTYYFIDKCMPFGAAISCSHFQRFSNAIAHIVTTKTGKDNINYLDDFFFTALLKAICNNQIQTFLNTCDAIKFPVSMEKTFWGTQLLSFLGLLLDTANQRIGIPVDKIERAKELINFYLNKKSKKMRVKQVQQLTGFLNFLCKAIVPGRTFLRRMYNMTANPELKPDHHVPITAEVRSDLELWLRFLNHESAYYRKFLDLSINFKSTELNWYTDATANPQLGAGGHFGPHWFILQWDEDFIINKNPSINYLELYAVTISVINWIHYFQDKFVTLFCDNMSVVHMINNNSSKCKNCMVLIRIIVLKALIHNVKITAKHVQGTSNIFADLLSRLRYDLFRKEARKRNAIFNNKPDSIPEMLWPMENIWLNTH